MRKKSIRNNKNHNKSLISADGCNAFSNNFIFLQTLRIELKKLFKFQQKMKKKSNFLCLESLIWRKTFHKVYELYIKKFMTVTE